MASLGPHRVKVDGEVSSLSSGQSRPLAGRLDSTLSSKATRAHVAGDDALPSSQPLTLPRSPSAAPAVKPDRHHHVARSEDGRLFYDNQWYCRGQAICINRKDEYPTRCVDLKMKDICLQNAGVFS